MKERILECMRRHPEAYPIETWLELCEIKDVKAITTFQETLDELVQEHEVVLTKKGKYILSALMGYTKGVLSIVNQQFGFVDGEEHTYVKRVDFNTAMHRDEVLIKRTIHTDGSADGKIIAIIKRNSPYILATLKKQQGDFILVPYGQKVVQALVFENPLKLELKDGNRYVVKVIEIKDKISVTLDQLMGHQNDIGMDVLSVLYEYDIDPVFPQEVLDESKAIPTQLQPQDYQGRKDLRDQLIFTIDGEDAKDLDDAISLVKNGDITTLGVHIADVSHYVSLNQPIDEEAFKRSTSTYVVDRVVPMLPEALSNGVCSLQPNVDRLTITCEMDFDEFANLLDYRVFPSVIHSKVRFTYTEVNRIFQGEPTENEYDDSVLETLTDMLDCARMLRDRKSSEGMIDFETSESKFILDQKGQVLDIYRSVSGEAQEMIEDFMVAANECVASLCRYQEVPILYRVHEKPAKDKMQAFSHLSRTLGYRMKGNLDNVLPRTIQKVLTHFKYEPSFEVVSKILLRSMSKARYDQQCLGHFGLALENYTHFTSPIRRYPDLIVHRALRQYVFNHDESRREADLARLDMQAKQTSKRERLSTEAERSVEKIKKCQYMRDKVGEHYEGTISGVTRFGFFVELDNTVEGLVHVKSLHHYYDFDELTMTLTSQDKKTSFHLGQRVKIKVSGVDMEEETVEFILPSQSRPKRRVHENRRRK